MWSGPRTLSTALMRSFENRSDTVVVDEPLYGYYLAETGIDHPGRDEILASMPTGWPEVVDELTSGPLPAGRIVYYQKHMTHHLLPEIPRGWMRELHNCFLIRDPGQMLTSLLKHVPDATIEDTGYPQQVEIFNLVREWKGEVPAVLDSRDVLDNPQRLLALLCDRLGVGFTEKMLSWPPGLRETDGVWAKYWYKEVQTTTTFRPFSAKDEKVPAEFEALARECDRFYRQLYSHRMT